MYICDRLGCSPGAVRTGANGRRGTTGVGCVAAFVSGPPISERRG